MEGRAGEQITDQHRHDVGAGVPIPRVTIIYNSPTTSFATFCDAFVAEMAYTKDDINDRYIYNDPEAHLYTDPVECIEIEKPALRAPQPRYGWRGQEESYCCFPIGTVVEVGATIYGASYGGASYGGASYGFLGEVIALDGHEKLTSDSVRLMIIESNLPHYPVGYKDFWSEWKCHPVN